MEKTRNKPRTTEMSKINIVHINKLKTVGHCNIRLSKIKVKLSNNNESETKDIL